MSNKHIFIIRVDPTRQNIAKIAMPCGRRPTDIHARKIVKAEKVGMREILQMDGGVVLCMFGGLDLDPPMDAFSIPGTDDTLGIGFFAGKGPGGGLVDVPVNIEWVQKRIRWTRVEADPE